MCSNFPSSKFTHFEVFQYEIAKVITSFAAIRKDAEILADPVYGRAMRLPVLGAFKT